jgi:aryl-alcohol dehydrogenase-like predicted oxidoreductase
MGYMLYVRFVKAYSNGASEILLGKAIKKFDFPRDEIVVMTKARIEPHFPIIWLTVLQLWSTVGREPGTNFYSNGLNPDEEGYINQHGLSRKVGGNITNMHSYLTPHF